MEEAKEQEATQTGICHKCGKPSERVKGYKRMCYECLGKSFEHSISKEKSHRKFRELVRQTAVNPLCAFQVGKFCTNRSMPWGNGEATYKKECSYKEHKRDCPLLKPWHSDIFQEILKRENEILADLKKEKELIDEMETEKDKATLEKEKLDDEEKAKV